MLLWVVRLIFFSFITAITTVWTKLTVLRIFRTKIAKNSSAVPRVLHSWKSREDLNYDLFAQPPATVSPLGPRVSYASSICTRLMWKTGFKPTHKNRWSYISHILIFTILQAEEKTKDSDLNSSNISPGYDVTKLKWSLRSDISFWKSKVW